MLPQQSKTKYNPPAQYNDVVAVMSHVRGQSDLLFLREICSCEIKDHKNMQVQIAYVR
jgi:hypothetical protein